MEIWEIDVWRQCEAHELTEPPAGRYRPRNWAVRCGATAERGLSWEGAVEGRHALLLCDRHTLQWLGPMVHEVGDESEEV